MAKTTRKAKIVRGTVRTTDGRSFRARADLSAPPVPQGREYSDAEIAHMLGKTERPRDRKGRFTRAGLLAKLTRR